MDTKNILVIGDIHEPFALDGYLDFCKRVYKQYKCTHVIFIGDVIDNHYSSFHPSDPDGYGAGEELKRATDQLALWHKAFPNADVTTGNHCRMAARKAFAAGLSAGWVRDLGDVLKVPTWKFQTSVTYDNVTYIHGEGVTARTKAMRRGSSVVQGHRHIEGYVWYHPTDNGQIFGMQVGCGIDAESYAFAYAKDHPPPVISCGVVLDNGKHAIMVPFDG